MHRSIWKLLAITLLVGSATGAFAAPCVHHSADTDAVKYEITISELLRVIQLYNSGAYHCQAGTEDGFAPGSGSHACAPHDSDYLTQDWVISLSEYLRIQQLYSLGAYHEEAAGEDGYNGYHAWYKSRIPAGHSGAFDWDVVEAAGEYVVVGRTYQSTDKASMKKIDRFGTLIWSQTYDDYSTLYAVSKVSSGGYIAVGEQNLNQGYVVRTNASGTMTWDATFGGSNVDTFWDVVEASDGGFIMVGTSNSTGTNGSNDLWVVKVNSSGSHVWTKFYGGTSADEGYGVDLLSNGKIAIVGRKTVSSDHYGYLAQLNSSGVLEWENTYANGINFRDVVTLEDGSNNPAGFIMGGTAVLHPDATGPKNEFWMVKATTTGAVTWDHSYAWARNSHTVAEQARDIIQTSDGNYALCGFSNSAYSVCKINTSGTQTAWYIHYPLSGFSGIKMSFAQAADGGFFVTGNSSLGLPHHIKMAPTGYAPFTQCTP